MTWDIPWFENIKKKACKYLLQRYLGQFLKEKLTLDRLSVDLYNGTGNVADVRLDVQALNELGEQQNWPLEFLDGYVENISVYVPVRSLLTESSFVKVNGLNITVQPKQRDEDATSMFESMWSCMTSSMQLAQECLQQEEGLDNTRAPPEGLELFANTIDSILSRVKVHFTDLVIRCEHVPKDSSSGVALEIRIKNLEYLDEAGGDPTNLETTDLTSKDHTKAYVVSSFTTKKLFFDGVTFHTDEFSSKSRTMSRSMSQSPVNTDTKNSSPNLNTSRDSDNEQYYMTASELPSENLQESPNTETTSNKKYDESQDCIPIIFAKLNGQQEIRIRLKQSEAISGPKVEIDMILGSLITFLTPRQLHALVELGSGLTSPDSENTSNVGNNPRCVQKEMTKSDYKRVEADLQAQLQPLAHLQGTGLQNLPGWSTASIGEDSDDDDFDTNTPFGGTGDMSESVLSTASSIESIVSNASSQTASSRSSRHASAQARRKGDSDPIEDIWHLELRISSVAVVLLHEDLLTPSADADDHPLAPSSVRHTAHKAQTFFEDLKTFVLTSHSNRDFEAATPVFDSACSSNHLRLFAAPIQLECTQQTSSHTVAMIGHCTTARFELTECLMADSENITNRSNTSINNDIQRIELLCFNSKTPQYGLSNKANISLTFKQSQKTVRYFQGKKRATKTKLRFHLDCCRSEFDITLIDRINALLNPNPLFCRAGNEPLSQKTPPYGTSTDNNYLEYKFDTEVVSPECIFKVRFPIPDLRPIHDMQRCPWWKRNVRSDYMTLKMENTYLCFSSHSRQPANRVELLMSALGISYTFKDSTSPINIGRASTNQNTLFGEQNKKISLVIHIYPRKLLNGEFDESSGADSEPLSMFEGFQPSKTPTPFSSRRVVHESDTSHAKHQDADSDREELVIPGNKQELQEFTDYATRSSRIQVDLYFPEVSVQLCSKHIFETIYNRISTDLLLWEPSAPRAYSGGYDGLYSCNVLSESIHPAFSMCKSGIQYDSEESGESDDEYYPYSVYESRRSKLRPQNYGNLPGQSTVSIMVTIGQGLLQMFTPVRDSVGNVIPGRQGEFLISLCDTSIFSVSGFRGNLDLGYVCVQAKSGILYHCGLIETPSGCPPLKEVGSIPGKNLLQTIYPTDPESKFPNSNTSSHSMLTVAIRIQANHETHHMKVIRVACAVNDATLRVNISRSEHTWLTQLQDMFDVLDYPIAGYNPSPVLTELHMHVWSSCIDYRPLHLPIRALITIGSFSISSNLVAQTRTNTLRIITEDCAVLLSNQCKSINVKISDYVCVMDSGLFELSLRYSDKPRGNNPQMDLRAYNNMIHIRTCADSGRALTQLIEYLALDGDLPVSGGISSTDLRPQTNVVSSNESSTNTLLNVEPVQQICDLSKSQHERVIEGISEAMEEHISLSSKEDADEQIPTGVKLFFFPDEDAPQSKIESTPLPQVASDLGDTTTICVPLPAPTFPPKRSDTDDEYDIIEKEVEIEGLQKSEKSVIWHVIDQAPRWVKNFDAVPVGRSDLLNAPKTFPTPITRYTLCEMNIIWHMYGGHDFKKTSTTDKKRENHKTVNFVSDKKSDISSSFDLPGNTAMYIKNDPEKIKFSTQKKQISTVDWKKQGGTDRNHDILIEFQLNKVRFRHEVYPEKTKEASRQMLLISELEIRDRLATSQINKFLYQYTTEARPKRAQTNMVIVKQLFVRPDPQLQREESILRVSVLPLRLNIDQDALLFLISFFSEMSGGNVSDTEKDVFTTNTLAQNTSKHNTPTHQPPIMTVATQQNEETSSLEDSLTVAEDAQKLISDNLLILLEDDLLAKTEDTTLKPLSEVTEVRPPVYFRDIRFDSEVPIRIDYHGKRVDMSGPGGALAGLLMGIGQLNCSEIKLRRFRYRHGILGFEKLVSYALHEWLTDIKKNQLPSLLGGVGPMYALVQLFQGIRDLFWLPIEQYQKDGRIVHGLQRGANSFTTSTAMAAIELTTRIIHLIQTTAETAYDMVSPGPSVKRRGHGKKGKKRYNQPQDFREGVSNAYTIVRDGLEETAYTLVRVASHEHEQKGYSGAVGGILRQIPPTVVKPIILATEATNNVLGGMVCELVPEVRREISQKWRNDDS